MAQLVDRRGIALSVAPVSRRFAEPSNDLEVNYLEVLCALKGEKSWRSMTLTVFNWELVAFARWLRELARAGRARPFDPNSETFAFWARAKGDGVHLTARLSGTRHLLLTTTQDLEHFAAQLETELARFPIATIDDV